MKHVAQKKLYLFLAVIFLSTSGMIFCYDKPPVSSEKVYEEAVTQVKPVPEGQDSHHIAVPFQQSPLSGDRTLLLDDGVLLPNTVGDYWIGIQCTEILPPLRTHLNLEEKQGILIELVMSESPADKAGIEQYDVFLTMNGEPVNSITDIVKVVEEAKDREMVISAIRRGKPIELKVMPEKRPDNIKIVPLMRERVLRSIQPGVIIEGLGPDSQMQQLPLQELPEDVRKMFEQIQNQMKEQMHQLPEAGDLRFDFPQGHFRFGGMPVGTNTVQITIEPAHDDVAATLTVRKSGQKWTVGKFADLPEDVQKEVAEILKNTVDGKDVGDWIAEQMAENRRVTFSVTTSSNVSETKSE